jgi:uncharacterized membrane protein
MFLLTGREAHTRSFVKAISWRFLGSLDTFLLGWLFTSSVKAAGSIALSEVLTKMVLYYFHERAWSGVGWGMKATAPALTPVAAEIRAEQEPR